MFSEIRAATEALFPVHIWSLRSARRGAPLSSRHVECKRIRGSMLKKHGRLSKSNRGPLLGPCSLLRSFFVSGPHGPMCWACGRGDVAGLPCPVGS